MIKKGKHNTEVEFDFNKDLFVQFIKEDDDKDYTEIAPVPDKVIPIDEYLKEKRLREILKGRSSILLVSHTKKEQKYHVVKGYWSDDYGNVTRSYNKSFLKLGVGLETRLQDIFEQMDYEVRLEVKFKKDKVRTADMVIKKGDQEFVVEYSKMELKDLATFYLNHSMWLDYQKLYQVKKE